MDFPGAKCKRQCTRRIGHVCVGGGADHYCSVHDPIRIFADSQEYCPKCVNPEQDHKSQDVQQLTEASQNLELEQERLDEFIDHDNVEARATVVNELVPVRPSNSATPEEDMRVFGTLARYHLSKLPWPDEKQEIGRRTAAQMRSKGVFLMEDYERILVVRVHKDADVNQQSDVVASAVDYFILDIYEVLLRLQFNLHRKSVPFKLYLWLLCSTPLTLRKAGSIHVPARHIFNRLYLIHFLNVNTGRWYVLADPLLSGAPAR